MAKKRYFKLNPKRNAKSVRINRVTVNSDSILSGDKWEQFAVRKDGREPVLVEASVKKKAVVSREKKSSAENEKKSSAENEKKSSAENEKKFVKKESVVVDKPRMVPDRNEMVEVFSELSGIGKVSAAKIYDSGICTLVDMAKADPVKLSETVGRFFTEEKAEVAINDARSLLLTASIAGAQG